MCRFYLLGIYQCIILFDPKPNKQLAPEKLRDLHMTVQVILMIRLIAMEMKVRKEEGLGDGRRRKIKTGRRNGKERRKKIRRMKVILLRLPGKRKERNSVNTGLWRMKWKK